MTQHDLIVANASGAMVRADINDALQALGSLSAGATAPSVTYPNMVWVDTANSLIKKRNNANTTWVTLGGMDTAYLGALQAALNLSDLTSAATARTNLGLVIGTDVLAYMAAASQAEMEAGTEAGLRSMSPLRVAQAIAALAGGGVSLAILSKNTDVSLTTAVGSGGDRVTNSGTLNIPASGLLVMLAIQNRIYGSGAGDISCVFAPEINGTVFFKQGTLDGGGSNTRYVPSFERTVGANYLEMKNGFFYSQSNYGLLAFYDIATLGCATGNQTVYVRGAGSVGLGYTDTPTLKGSVTPTIFAIFAIGA